MRNIKTTPQLLYFYSSSLLNLTLFCSSKAQKPISQVNHFLNRPNIADQASSLVPEIRRQELNS